ncbi:3-ketoacyl-CoA thiolase, peroxisomal, partial [Penicillium rolfsii]
QQRLSQVSSHFGSSSQKGAAALTQKNPDDIVVTCALRTALTKGGKGGFKDTAAADLLAGVFKAVIQKSGIDPKYVEDIAVGSVLPPGGGATEFRAAALVAGFPETAAVKALNRQCSSGLQAVVDVANAIKSGMIEVGIGAGVESMTSQYGPGAVTEFSELLESHPESANCKVPMGVLSENMAKDRGISRASQDAFAASSYQKAVKAQKAGLFDEEIAPLEVKWTDPKTGEEKTITVKADDGIREGMTAESLGKIRPAFAKDGSIHAGNASQISDGAAAVLLMKRSTAERLGQKIIGKYVTASVVGVKPLLMGIGPWAAIPVALQKANITKDEVDIYEINEAFASQCVWCVNELGLPSEKINPKGGAIAFGHPLGCTGARQVSTLLTELKRTNKKIGVTSMCVGTGMGMAAVWVADLGINSNTGSSKSRGIATTPSMGSQKIISPGDTVTPSIVIGTSRTTAFASAPVPTVDPSTAPQARKHKEKSSTYRKLSLNQLSQISHPSIHNRGPYPQNLHPGRHDPTGHRTILITRLINDHNRARIRRIRRGKVAHEIDPMLSRREAVFLGILECDCWWLVGFGKESECCCWRRNSLCLVVSANYWRERGCCERGEVG